MTLFIIGGFVAISAAWGSLYRAQKSGALALGGLYAWVRHPQYVGFMAIMVGFLLQWPTIPTLIMFPVLVAVYRRLAITEERDTRAHFGAEWDAYAAVTPRFLPRHVPRAARPPRSTDVPAP